MGFVLKTALTVVPINVVLKVLNYDQTTTFSAIASPAEKRASAPELGNDFLELVSQHFSTNHNSTLIFVELTHGGFAWAS